MLQSDSMNCLSAGRTRIPLWENHSHTLPNAADRARDKAIRLDVLDVPFPTNQIRSEVVFKGMISCLPVSFYHRRELHGIALSLNVDRKLHQPFSLKLSDNLKEKGFLIKKSALNNLIGTLNMRSASYKSFGGATLYSESLLFTGEFVDQNGVVRWGRRFVSRGFGFTKEEAEKDSVNRIIIRIVRSINLSVRVYNDPITSSFQGRMIPIQNALLGWVSR